MEDNMEQEPSLIRLLAGVTFAVVVGYAIFWAIWGI